MTVRVVRGMAELGVDPPLELLGQGVLETVGLVVDVLERDAERLGEVLLKQAVVPHHLERDTAAALRERHAAVGRVDDQLGAAIRFSIALADGAETPIAAATADVVTRAPDDSSLNTSRR